MSSMSTEAAQPEACRLCSLDLKAGMRREDAEKLIAAALGAQSTYKAHESTLRGGVVIYSDRGWVLKITYKSGAPAPWVLGKDGVATHYPPVDETVLEHEIISPKQ